MFNFYDWGGYLLWRLAPRKAFVDGRGADPELMEEYRQVMEGDRRLVEGQEAWRRALERHDVRLTVTPFFHPESGRLVGLVDVLLADPAWVPVFSSATALVFARNTWDNRGVLRRFALLKPDFYSRLLDYTRMLAILRPEEAAPHVARGDLLLRLGDPAAALRSYEQALRIVPSHPAARGRIAQLRGEGGP